MGCHALDCIGFLSVGVHGLSPFLYNGYENLLDPIGALPLQEDSEGGPPG